MGDEGRENTQEARSRRRESRSREETKDRYTDLRPRKYDVRTDRRHDHKESYTDIRQQQRLTSHETESESLLLKKMVDRERREPKTRYDERINRSGYPVRQGERICRSYRHTGLCVYGSNCLFDHPRCKFFLRGACKEGSACKFLHAMDTDVPRLHKERDGAEPMRQGSRRRETESAYWKEEKETKDRVLNIEKKYNRSLSQICDAIVAGYKREKMEKEQKHGQDFVQEQRQRDNTERQRRESQENVQEHRQRDTTGWQIYFEKKRRKREAQENVQRETNGRKRDFEKEKSEAQENAQEQKLMEIAEDHKVDAHGQENMQVERQRESIERQTREAQEMERRKTEVFLEEQRVKDKLDEKRQRDVEKLEIETEESSEEQRLKEHTFLDSKVNERLEEIRSQMIDETLDGFKRARMAKALPGYIRARKMEKKFEESVEEQRLKEKHAHDQPNKAGD